MKITDILSEDLVLPARAGGLRRRALEGPGAHLAAPEGRVVPSAAHARDHGRRPLSHDPRGGRQVLTVRVRELLGEAGTALRLRLVSGACGLERVIAVPRLQQPRPALAGYLPQLHPDRVQVLGNSEVSYLATLDPGHAREAGAGGATTGAACFVATNDAASPAALTEAAEAAGLAVRSEERRVGKECRS